MGVIEVHEDKWVNNAIESWNIWILSLRNVRIPWLVIGHLQKIGLKFDKRKKEMQ